MKRRLHALFLSTALAALALAPATVVTTLAGADAAWANNGKGNGGGGGGGKGNGGGGNDRGGKPERSASNGGGKPSWAGQGGKPAWAGQGGSGKSQQARGGDDPVGTFLRKLTGQDKQEERRARIAARKAPTEFAPTVSKSPGKRPARFSDMHPSDLGNMNGALNANINAVLAHVRNGNTNGPVGHMALLAVADANVAEARETVALGEQYADLEAALALGGWSDVQAYYDALDAGTVTLSPEEQAELDEAIIALGGDPETGLGLGVEAPTPEEVAEAEAALPALELEQFEATARVVEYWNKNPDGTPNLTEADFTDEELALIEDMRERLIGYEGDIAAAIEDAGMHDPSDEDTADADDACEARVPCNEEQALLSE